MRNLITIFLCYSALGSAAAAQDFYGSTSVALGYVDLFDGDGVNNEGGDGATTSASAMIGLSFGDVFVEGEIDSFSYDPDSPRNEMLSTGLQGGLRLGYDFGDGRVDVFGGAVHADTNDGTSERFYYGFSGGYMLGERFAATGSVSMMDGTEGTDDNGLDGPRDMVTLGLGATYFATDDLSFDVGYFRGTGVMDQDRNDFEFDEVALGFQYDIGDDGLSVFGRVTYADLFQGQENDDAQEFAVSMGLTYRFGGSSAPQAETATRAPLPRYMNVLGNAAGVVE